MNAAPTTLTIGTRPVFHAARIVEPTQYAKDWAARAPGKRVHHRCYHFAVYASAFVETDSGVEIEVSALVDLRPGHWATTIDDVRCRLVPNGAEVELEDETIEGLRDELVDAARRAAS